MKYQVAAFYRFTALANPREFGEVVRARASELDLIGTFILAPEGINSTLSGRPEKLQAFLAWLESVDGFADLAPRVSFTNKAPFKRFKIKHREEIVSMGFADVNPANGQGQHVDAATWNQLLADPQTLVIDTRNDYEVEVGTFPGAADPRTKNFREFADYVTDNLAAEKSRPIAMFCTGGIRCEKATAVMKTMGFENLYQLNGGILGYLDQVGDDEAVDNQWQGECFVFDDRVALDSSLKPGDYVQCHACRRPLAPADLASPHYVEGISCARCIDESTPTQREQFAQRQLQIELARKRGEAHIGKHYPKTEAGSD